MAEVRSPTDGVLFALPAEAGKPWDDNGAIFEIAAEMDSWEIAVIAPPELLCEFALGWLRWCRQTPQGRVNRGKCVTSKTTPDC